MTIELAGNEVMYLAMRASMQSNGWPDRRRLLLRRHGRSGGRVYKENDDYWVESVAYPTRALAAQAVWEEGQNNASAPHGIGYP